jgi:hypothetical protein
MTFTEYKEKRIWVTKEKRIKAEENNRKRPNVVSKKKEN